MPSSVELPNLWASLGTSLPPRHRWLPMRVRTGCAIRLPRLPSGTWLYWKARAIDTPAFVQPTVHVKRVPVWCKITLS